MSDWGHRISLSPGRKLIGDLMHASRNVPSVPMERRMRLAPLAATRTVSAARIGWCAIFTQAWAMVAARRPQLRRSYLTFPWPHLFEHAESVASIAVERQIDREDVVLFSLLRAPETLSLPDVQMSIDRAKHDPIQSIREFRRALRISRWPGFARRGIWWYGLQASGSLRAKSFGTFGVSSTASLGASQLTLHSPLTTTVFYSPFDKDGSLDVRVIFDHRVIDGATVARALADMESVLLDEIRVNLSETAPRLSA